MTLSSNGLFVFLFNTCLVATKYNVMDNYDDVNDQNNDCEIVRLNI